MAGRMDERHRMGKVGRMAVRALGAAAVLGAAMLFPRAARALTITITSDTELSDITEYYIDKLVVRDQLNTNTYTKVVSYTTNTGSQRYALYGGESTSGNTITLTGIDVYEYFKDELPSSTTIMDVAGGHSSTGGDVKDNTIVMDGSQAYNVYGGFSFSNSGIYSKDDEVQSGTVSGNTVALNGTAGSAHSVYGGYSYNKGSASDNVVIISALTSDGFSALTSADISALTYDELVALVSEYYLTAEETEHVTKETTDEDTGVTTSEIVVASTEKTVDYGLSVDYIDGYGIDEPNYSVYNVYGGYCFYGGTVSGNSVYVINSIVDSVYGGFAYANITCDETSDYWSTAEKNTVVIINSTVSVAYGAYSNVGDANYNSVTLIDSYMSSYSTSTLVVGDDDLNRSPNYIMGVRKVGVGDAIGNSVTITDSTVYTYYICGVRSSHITDSSYTYSGNSVTINGKSNVLRDSSYYGEESTYYIIGAYAYYGEVSLFDNGVVIDLDSTDYYIEAEVYGAYHNAGAMSGNYAIIKNGTIIGNVVGALSNAFVTTDDSTGYDYNGMLADGSSIYLSGNSVSISGGIVCGGFDSDGNPISNGAIVAGAYFLNTSVSPVTENSVSITGSSTVAAKIYGGYSTGYKSTSSTINGYAALNSVAIALDEDGSVTGDIYGGYSSAGMASGNSVSVNGTVTGDVYGGYVGTTYSQGTVDLADEDGDGVYDSYTYYATGGTGTYSGASANAVTVTGGTLTGDVFGGYVYGTSSSDSVLADADANTVTVSGGTLTGSVYGGYIRSSSATSGTRSADDNVVTVSGGSVTCGVYGGYIETVGSGSASVSSNEVSVSADVSGSVYGGYIGTAKSSTASATTSMTENTVTVSGGTLTGSVYGAYVNSLASTSSSATNVTATLSGNVVKISAGSVAGDVAGGYVAAMTSSRSGSAANVSGNKVEITGGSVGSTDSPSTIYGGYVTTTQYYPTISATGNTVAIGSDATVQVSAIYGGYVKSNYSVTNNSSSSATEIKSTTSGNTVSVAASESSLGTVYGGYAYSYSGSTNTSSTSTYKYGANAKASSSDNEIEISGEAGINGIYGGYSQAATQRLNAYKSLEASTATATASGNAITVTDAELTGTEDAEIVGGAALASLTVNNYGNITGNATASGNSVVIADAEVSADVTGGYAAVTLTTGSSYSSSNTKTASVTVSGNTVDVLSGSVTGDVAGGRTDGTYSSTDTVSVSGNTVNVAYAASDSSEDDGTESEDEEEETASLETGDVTITGSVYGGKSDGYAAVTGNSVSLGDGESAVTVSGDVYGGYTASGTATANAVSMYGNVAVSGTVYGGHVVASDSSDDGTAASSLDDGTATASDDADTTDTSDYNTLWVAGTGNSATTVDDFDSITFDIAGLSTGDVMLTLTSTDGVDLTDVTTIGLDEDNAAIGATPGATLYLIVTTNGLTVSASSIQDISSTAYYTLSEAYDTANGTDNVEDGATLAGTYTREIAVVTVGEDGSLTTVSVNDDGNYVGDDLVLWLSDTVNVSSVDFNFSSSSDGGSAVTTLTWGDADGDGEDDSTRLTLVSGVKYAFSSETEVAAITAVTADVSGTLIADDSTTLLMDGSTAASVSGLDDVDLSASQNITVTYTPADGVTVTNSAKLVATGASEDGSTSNDSLALQSTGITNISFGTIDATDATDNTMTLITLVSGVSYDMKSTTLDFSNLCVSGATYGLVITLIDANGAVTNLDQNTASMPSESLGYTLAGTAYDSSTGTGAYLTGSIEGSVSVVADISGATGSYDLVLTVGDEVEVASVTFDFEDGTADGTVTVALGTGALITLDSSLTYDFASAVLTDTSATIELTGDGTEGTLVADTTTLVTLIDTNGATITTTTDGESTMTAFTSQINSTFGTYTYSPVDGVSVTAGATATTSGSTISLASSAITQITFGTIAYSTDALITLTTGSTYDMKETTFDVSDLTLTDTGDTEFTAGEIVMTLIDANGATTNLGSNSIASASAETSVELGYLLTGEGYSYDSATDITCGAYLSGTMDGYVTADYDASTDASGTYADLVLVAGTEISVDEVQFDGVTVTTDTESYAVTAGGDALITLTTGLTYDFTDVTVAGSDSLEVDGVESTLVAPGTALVTLVDVGDATVANTVDENGDETETSSITALTTAISNAYSSYTYEPATGVTVTSEASASATTDDDGNVTGVTLTSGAISSISFGEVEYSTDAIITLDGTSTYDLSGTSIDVSGLTFGDGATIVDDGSNSSFAGVTLLMLIDANGSVTNLDENAITGSTTSLEFGYLLEGLGYYSTTSASGTTYTGGAYLTGSIDSSVAVVADASENENSYDLVVQAGDAVEVDEVSFDLSYLAASDDEDDDDGEESDSSALSISMTTDSSSHSVTTADEIALLTLNSALTYDFSSASLAESDTYTEDEDSDDEDSEDEESTDSGYIYVDGVEDTLIADGTELVTLLDVNGATVTTTTDSDGNTVSSLETFAEEVSESYSVYTYTYDPATGVTVEGTTSVSATTDDDGNVTGLSLTSGSIGSITFTEIVYADTATLILDADGTYDLSGTTISASDLTLVDSNENPVTPTAEGGEIIMYLIDTNGVDTGLEDNDITSGETVSQTFGYELIGTDGDGVANGASLDGSLTGTVTVEAGSSEDSTTDTYDLVLKADIAVDVATVDLGLSETENEDGETENASVAWGSSTVLTLNSALTYDFGGTTDDEGNAVTAAATVEGIDDLTVTGISGTLIADGETSTLLDGSSSTVSGLDEVDLSDLAPTITYTPADGVSVTGTALLVATGANEDGSTSNDSIALKSSSIDEITFGDVTYGKDALLTLDSSSTYDLSETDIDVSDLTVVDDGSGAINGNFDGGELVMTLIDADGAVTNLGSNSSIADGAETEQTFGYLLEGSDYDPDEGTGSSLSGTLQGILAAEADASGNDGSYDLVVRTGTEVVVTEVTLDISTLDAETDAPITLSALTYDFTDAELDVTTETGSAAIENATTLLTADDTIMLIDGSSAISVIGLEGSDLDGYSIAYSYTLEDGAVEVTGSGTTAVSSDGKSLGYTVTDIGTLDFYIDDGMDGTTVLTVESSVDLSGTAITAYATTELYAGYSVTLLYAYGGITTDEYTSYTGKAYEGVSLVYDLTVEKSDDNTIVAYIAGEGSEDGSSSGKRLRDETRSLLATRIAQTALVDQGADQLTAAFDDAFRTAREKTEWTPYVAFSAGDFDYSINAGGKVELDSFNAAVGLLRNYFRDDGVFSWGPVFQYGKADYDAWMDGVFATGEAEHVGGGIFARRRWNSGTYLEGAITGGYSNGDFNSVTILSGVDEKFSVGSPYWTAYLGLAKDIDAGENRTFKPYIRYWYSRLSSSDAYLSSGEHYEFDELISSRLRAGFRMTWNIKRDDGKGYELRTYLGAAYNYQFEGEETAAYRGYSTNSATLRGGSGVFEGGLQYRPEDSSMTIDLGLSGWVGAQEGVEGLLKFKWDM